MDKLTLIRFCINNNLKVIEELEKNLVELRVKEQIALFEQQLEEDFPL